MAMPTLSVQIDWSLNDVFTDANEDVTPDALALRITMGRQGPLGIAQPTSCELVLANEDKLYSPENSGGALFGSLLPGRKVRIRATAPSAQVLFIGRVDDIRVQPTLEKRNVLIPCFDDMVFLAREIGTIYSPQTGLVPLLEPDSSGIGPLTGVAVAAVLDAIGWDSGDRTIDTGISEMDTWWTLTDGLAALQQLVTEEMGFAYVDKAESAAGFPMFIFEDRSHRYKGAHLTSQATYSDDPTAALRYDSFDPYGLGIENVYNKARAQARPRKASASEQVWTLGIPEDSSGAANPPSIAPGETRTFIPTWDNPASDTYVITFTANSSADGTGEDLTGSVAKAESNPKANRYTVKLLNATDPGQTVYITSMFLTVNIRLPQDEPTEGEAEDGTSQSKYGVRQFPLAPQFIGKSNNADDWAGYAMAAFKSPISIIRLGFGPYDDTILSEMLSRKLSDRVTVVNDELGLNADFFVEGIEYELVAGEDGPKEFRTTMVLSKVATDNQFFLFNDAVLGRFAEFQTDEGYGAFFG